MSSKNAAVAAAAAAVALPVLAIGCGVLAVAGAVPSFGGMATAGLNVAAVPAGARPYVQWYLKAGALCEGITPALLVAQGQAESNFNPTISSSAGAVGIAQFLPSTYNSYGQDADGNGINSPTDPPDAIMAQGKFMCSLYKRAKDSGFSGDPVALTLAGYNAGWGAVEKYGGVPPYKETTGYISTIVINAKKWVKTISAVSGSGAGPDAARRAAQYLGTPYVWGGGTPDGPSTGFCDGRNGYLHGACFASTHQGFDCSSLVQLAYWHTVKLPRVAADQYQATASRPIDRNQLQVGDLIFWSKSGASGIYHVAIYYGNGQIVQAPRTGKNVEVVPLDRAMPSADYFGATRP